MTTLEPLRNSAPAAAWELPANVVLVIVSVELITMSVAGAPAARLLKVESRMTKLCPSIRSIAPGSVSSWVKSTPAAAHSTPSILISPDVFPAV